MENCIPQEIFNVKRTRIRSLGHQQYKWPSQQYGNKNEKTNGGLFRLKKIAYSYFTLCERNRDFGFHYERVSATVWSQVIENSSLSPCN